MTEQTNPAADVSEVPSQAPAAPSSAGNAPVSLSDEAALRATAPELSKQIDARLASWEVTEAIVDSVNDSAALANLKDGRKGRIARRDFGTPAPEAGATIRVLVENEGANGELVLSHDKVEKLRLWAAAQVASESNQLVEGTVVAKSGNGLSVDIGLRAFLPAAQSGVPRGKDVSELLGQRLAFGISKFDRRTGQVELARRALVQAERAERKKSTLSALREGAILEGVVKNLTDYGAFIDLGGVDGLLHVSDMSWTRIKHPRELVASGDEVRVQVLKYDAAGGKISLGLKQLEQDPWADAAARFAAGATVPGKVLSLTDFGAFIEVAPGVEGLVHVSEMSWARIKHPSEVMKPGDEVQVVVLEVDAATRRLRLGTRQLQKNPWTLVEENYPVGSVLKSTVRNVVDFGLFVAMQEGIDGFVHVSDLSWTQRVRHPGDLYKKGDEIEAVVLSIDVENERISLGVKQAQQDPWMLVADKHPIGSTLKGKVMRTTPFGAFVEIEPGIEGLVHVSELREERVDHPADVVQENEIIEVRVLDIDPDARKIALSARPAPVATDDYRSFMNDENLGRAKLGEVFAEKLKSK